MTVDFLIPKQSKLIVALVIFGLISIFQLQPNYLPIAAAASPYSSKPTNIENIKNKLLDSLFIISYENRKELGFVGNYSLSQSTTDEGYKSGIITSRFLLEQCFYQSYESRNFRLEIELKGKPYKGTCWGWATTYVDMATVYTALEVPSLPLWDSYIPKIGGWLIAAYFVPGFGITFRETTVGIINKETFILGVEKFSPEPTGSALLFNQDGSFVGILTAKGVGTVPKEYFKVHGAPLQCSPAGTTGSAITNCNTRNSTNDSAQAGVWTIDETATPKPSPTPTPSPTKSAVDASIAAYDAFNAALDSHNLGREAKNDCLRAYQSSNTATRRILNLVSGSKICSSQDVLVNAAYQRLLSLDPDKSTVKDPLVLIDRLNDITGQFDIFAVAMDEGVVFAEELRDSANDLGDVEALIEVLETLSSSIETVLERLPSKIKNSLYSKPEVANFIDLNNEFLETSEEFKGALSEFSGLSDVDFEALEDFKSSIYLASRLLPSEASMEDAETNALKVIPSFYCKKGKVLSLPSKGKCSSGSKKVKIDKTW
jgi:hypothetical protein